MGIPRRIGRSGNGAPVGVASPAASRGAGRSGAPSVVAGSGPTLGVNSMTFVQINTSVTHLDSSSLVVPNGAFVFACVGRGSIADMQTPTDSAGNTYSPLLAAHNYQNWLQSGTRLYAASGVTGASNLVVSESMATNTADEVTLSVVEVHGGSAIVNALVSETPTTGPVTTSNIAVTGNAVLLSWWWGDGATTETTITPSAGWTKLHEINQSMSVSGEVQVALAARSVSAGTYSCTWTAAGPDQGAVVYIAAVQ